VFVEENGAEVVEARGWICGDAEEVLKACGWVLEDGEDCLAVGDCEADGLRVGGEGGCEVLGGYGPVVAAESCRECEDERIRYADAGEEQISADGERDGHGERQADGDPPEHAGRQRVTTLVAGLEEAHQLALEPFGASPRVLVEQRGSELSQAGGRLVERQEDRFAFAAVESEDTVVSGERPAELHLEFLVVHQARQTQDAPVGNVDTAEKHQSSVHPFWEKR
jgi:hypothetical protein